MPQVFLSLGSNIDRQKNIRNALDALAECFGFMRISSIYQTQAVGFKGDDFYNLVVAINTPLRPSEINRCLKQIEHRQGRHPSQKGFVARTIDIDLLTYGEHLGELDGVVFPRDEILKYAFVLFPLTELAGEQLCPGTQQTYSALWAEMKHRIEQQVDSADGVDEAAVSSQLSHKIEFSWCKYRAFPATHFEN